METSHNQQPQGWPKNAAPQRMGPPILAVLNEAAAKIGATILVEPQWKCVGQVRYPSGAKRYFKLSSLDLNTMGASAVARDKDFARFFLRDSGHSIPDGMAFLSPDWAKQMNVTDRGIDDAWRYAEQLGGPVFVKPNSGSQGLGVAKATTRDEFYAAANVAMEMGRVILVERAVRGRDYRIVVLDGKVHSAYERIPLTVFGDGTSSVGQLLAAKGEHFAQIARDEAISPDSFKFSANLKRQNLNFDSVLTDKQSVRLLDNANLSAGGTAVDVSDVVHPGFARIAAQISYDMGLRMSGVDLMIDGDITMPPSDTRHWVIEINSAPGMDNFARMGPKQKAAVADIYFKALQAMERRDEIFAPDAVQSLRPL